MREKFYAELSRRLREKGIESSCAGTQNLNVLLHGQPVLFVAPSSESFILPAGSQNEEVNDLYHRVGETADEVYEYVEAVQGAPLLHASDLKEEFRLLPGSDRNVAGELSARTADRAGTPDVTDGSRPCGRLPFHLPRCCPCVRPCCPFGGGGGIRTPSRR